MLLITMILNFQLKHKDVFNIFHLVILQYTILFLTYLLLLSTIYCNKASEKDIIQLSFGEAHRHQKMF